MNILSRLAAPALLGAAILFASEHDAHALGPVDIEAGLRVGVGTTPDADAVNPFGVGVGGRAGVSVFNVYGGLSAIHYFGSSKDILNQKVQTASTLLGLELGYSIKLIRVLTLRPQLGIGNVTFSSSVGNVDGDSKSKLYLEPGVTGLFSLGLLYVGADLNVLLIPGVERALQDSKTYTSFTAHGQIGIQF